MKQSAHWLTACDNKIKLKQITMNTGTETSKEKTVVSASANAIGCTLLHLHLHLITENQAYWVLALRGWIGLLNVMGL